MFIPGNVYKHFNDLTFLHALQAMCVLCFNRSASLITLFTSMLLNYIISLKYVVTVNLLGDE